MADEDQSIDLFLPLTVDDDAVVFDATGKMILGAESYEIAQFIVYAVNKLFMEVAREEDDPYLDVIQNN